MYALILQSPVDTCNTWHGERALSIEHRVLAPRPPPTPGTDRSFQHHPTPEKIETRGGRGSAC